MFVLARERLSPETLSIYNPSFQVLTWMLYVSFFFGLQTYVVNAWDSSDFSRLEFSLQNYVFPFYLLRFQLPGWKKSNTMQVWRRCWRRWMQEKKVGVMMEEDGDADEDGDGSWKWWFL